MKMPGFTAEASLYQTSEVYEHSMVWISSADGQEVMPQGPPPPPGSSPGYFPDPHGYYCRYGACRSFLTGIGPTGKKMFEDRRVRCCYWYGYPLGCEWVNC